MINWKSFLHKDQTSWLVESGDASIRYFTLHDLLGGNELLDTGWLGSPLKPLLAPAWAAASARNFWITWSGVKPVQGPSQPSPPHFGGHGEVPEFEVS
jgi:hypothetical protein